jgi:hypothetical protein
VPTIGRTHMMETVMFIRNTWYVAAWSHEVESEALFCCIARAAAASLRSRIVAVIAARHCRLAGARAIASAACITV